MAFSVLKRLFATFLRTRAITRHFRRLVLLETVTRTGVSREVPPALASELTAVAQSDVDALLTASGFPRERPHRVPSRGGARATSARTRWSMRSRCPGGCICGLLPDSVQPAADVPRGGLVFDRGHQGHHRHRRDGGARTLIRFWQETKSNRAAERLKAMVSNTATVIRRDIRKSGAGGQRAFRRGRCAPSPRTGSKSRCAISCPATSCVLSAGDMIPADCRLLGARTCS